MRINNNIMAMNTHRQYAINNDNLAKATEKLSSGYRINSAADDAAGLAISEKMRAQIRGLNMASKNSEDAISLVQTGEGALEETESILQRMRELAVQSSSDTNEDSVDRAALDAEYQQMIAEIDDIASKTDFNGMSLLDGSLTSGFQVSASGTYGVTNASGTAPEAFAAGITLTGSDLLTAGNYTINTTDFSNGVAEGVLEFQDGGGNTIFKISSGDDSTDWNSSTTYQVTNSTGTAISGVTIKLSSAAVTNIAAANTDGLDFTVSSAEDQAAVAAGLSYKAGAEGQLAAGTYTVSYSGNQLTLSSGGSSYTVGDGVSALTAGTYDVKDGSNNVVGQLSLDASAAGAVDNAGALELLSIAVGEDHSIVFQTGANEGDTLAVSIGDMSSNGLKVKNSSISSHENASSAITTVNDAINSVSTQRAHLGALQNRLDHKINNLDTSSENLQSAESRIRDVDMAQEMTEYTQTSILVQAATSMLAQANAAPQNVLSLLQ